MRWGGRVWMYVYVLVGWSHLDEGGVGQVVIGAGHGLLDLLRHLHSRCLEGGGENRGYVDGGGGGWGGRI